MQISLSQFHPSTTGYWTSSSKYECCSSLVPGGDYVAAASSECVVGSQSSPGKLPFLSLSLLSSVETLSHYYHSCSLSTHFHYTGHDFDSIVPCSSAPPPSAVTGPSFVSSVCAPGAIDELGGRVTQQGESFSSTAISILTRLSHVTWTLPTPALQLPPLTSSYLHSFSLTCM